MSNFSRFQQRNRDRAVARDRSNARFIFAGYPSIMIKDAAGNEKSAAVVNQQEKDSAYVYTNVNEPLAIGSVWEAKSLHLLITEEIIVIKKVDWRKYKAILCNFEIDGVWGWFKGPEETFVNVTLREDVLLQSLQHPILVLPEGTLNIGDKIAIKGRGWLVQEEDKISTEGISYYSVRATTISKNVTEEHINEEIYIEEDNDITPSLEEESEENTIRYVYPTTKNEISTENGYFKTSNTNIDIISKSKENVIFSIPFGIDGAKISVKEAGEIITYTYIIIKE